MPLGLDTDPNSPGEAQLALAIVAEDLPRPECGFQVRLPNGKNARLDFAWPSQKLAVEVDGGRFIMGGGAHATAQHHRRRNALVLLGWRILSFSPEMLDDDPWECTRAIREALDANP